MPASSCRICSGVVQEFFDFGSQPLSDAFVTPGAAGEEFFFRLAVGICRTCTMVQLVEEVPRDRMFHQDYPYVSSGSSVMRDHFRALAEGFLSAELAGPDPFIVELGCNDGTMLSTVAKAGVRHLGIEPSGGVADMAVAAGVRVRKEFFDDAIAADILATDGPADIVYAANTLCHIPYIDSVLSGVDRLLTQDGVFVFEDPYFGDIIEHTSFDQIYDEHFYFFTVRSVQEMARRTGFELVDVTRIAVHGGEIRYTLARPGTREQTSAVGEILTEELARGLADMVTLEALGKRVDKARTDLTTLLDDLADKGQRVVGYGATAKSATVTNFCGIGPDRVEYICDTTEAKQGKLAPGSHIPVREPSAFSDPYPPYALLFAWNHTEEIMAKEQGFREAGGKWIRYVPDVRIV